MQRDVAIFPGKIVADEQSGGSTIFIILRRAFTVYIFSYGKLGKKYNLGIHVAHRGAAAVSPGVSRLDPEKFHDHIPLSAQFPRSLFVLSAE